MQDTAAHLDFETKSATDLRKAGVYRYAEDPTTRPFGFTYHMGDGVLKRWRPNMPDPVELLDHVARGGRFVAHNAAFERTIWNMVLRYQMGLLHWPEIKIEQQDCTMARASAVAYPGDLDTLAQVIGQVQRKDREGHNLMLKMSKPRKIHVDGTIQWYDDPRDIERLETYQDQDVRTETETDQLLPPLTPREREVWQLDQRINDRGIFVDEALIMRAADLVIYAKANADKRMRELTNGAVKKCSEVKSIVAWLATRGLAVDSLGKQDGDDIIAVCEFIGDDTVRSVVKLRKEASKTSTSKYEAMLKCVCSDSRIRGLLEYCGARRTGRWSGRLVQPQNFPRVDPDYDGPLVEFMTWVLSLAIPAQDAHKLIIERGYEPLPALSKALRGMFCAAPGNKLVGGDFSNIEGRVNAWLARETWKLEAFYAYDLGYGPDLYKLAYANTFGVSVDSVGKGKKRQIGKVEELACGYQGSVGAFITMGDTYGLKVYDIVGPVMEATDPMAWDEQAKLYEKSKDKFGLTEAQWTAVKIVVKGFRKANSNIVQGWWDAQDAAIAAVDNPYTLQPCYFGRVNYMCDGQWLYCQLPSGRTLFYAHPHIRESVQVLVSKEGEEYERVRRNVAFYGMNSKTRQWGLQYMYGGHQCENIVQATSRCLMDRAMSRVEAAGYPLVLTVHDELLAEVAKTFGSAPQFADLMAVLPEWADGLPVAAAAWEDQRYVK